MSALAHQPGWASLFRTACSLIRQVNSPTTIIDHWTFGGGTALMLQIGHRESHDVDIFLQDPQLLAFLDPQKNDFEFEIPLSGLAGDGIGFQRFSFSGIGEIDFIISLAKTARPTILREIEGEMIRLETVPEIITKKVVHRGSNIAPRDIFDIAAAGEGHEDLVVAALRSYKTEVNATLDSLQRFHANAVNEAISQLQIRKGFEGMANSALERTRQILKAAL